MEFDTGSGGILNLQTLHRSNISRPPQKLLFSATLSQDPEKLEKLSLFQPKLFTSLVTTTAAIEENGVGDLDVPSSSSIGKYTTPNELTENYIVSSMNLKPLVLYKLIRKRKLTKTLIFTHSIDSAHRLAILLRVMFGGKKRIEEISSNVKSTRGDLIRKFTDGEIDLLICTDALARGIDLPDVECVVSYSVPKHLKTYIHRVGRTARAGTYGWTVTLVHPEQIGKFKGLVEQTGKTDIEQVCFFLLFVLYGGAPFGI